MSDEPENLMIRFLQELRKEMQEMPKDVTNRINGNTLLLHVLAGFAHEQRIG